MMDTSEKRRGGRSKCRHDPSDSEEDVKAGKIHFVRYATLPTWTGSGKIWLQRLLKSPRISQAKSTILLTVWLRSPMPVKKHMERPIIIIVKPP